MNHTKVPFPALGIRTMRALHNESFEPSCQNGMHNNHSSTSLHPEFYVEASNVHVLAGPSDFYETLLGLFAEAKKRLILTSLYIGTGEREQRIISVIANTFKQSVHGPHADSAAATHNYANNSTDNSNVLPREATNDSVRYLSQARSKFNLQPPKKTQEDDGPMSVDILIDAARGKRWESNGNSLTVLRPLLDIQAGQRLQERCQIVNRGAIKVSLFHSPLLSNILHRILPQRVNEVLGVFHTKIFMADDTVLLTGANLSGSYLTNRQDRYVVIRDCKALCDYLHGFVKTVSKFSFDGRLVPTSTQVAHHKSSATSRKQYHPVVSSTSNADDKFTANDSMVLELTLPESVANPINQPQKFSEQLGEALGEFLHCNPYSPTTASDGEKSDTIRGYPKAWKFPTRIRVALQAGFTVPAIQHEQDLLTLVLTGQHNGCTSTRVHRCCCCIEKPFATNQIDAADQALRVCASELGPQTTKSQEQPHYIGSNLPPLSPANASFEFANPAQPRVSTSESSTRASTNTFAYTRWSKPIESPDSRPASRFDNAHGGIRSTAQHCTSFTFNRITVDTPPNSLYPSTASTACCKIRSSSSDQCVSSREKQDSDNSEAGSAISTFSTTTPSESLSGRVSDNGPDYEADDLDISVPGSSRTGSSELASSLLGQKADFSQGRSPCCFSSAPPRTECSRIHSIVVSSGYLNMSDRLLRELSLVRHSGNSTIAHDVNNAPLDLFMAAPEANSFHRSAGLSKYIPMAYAYVAGKQLLKLESLWKFPATRCGSSRSVPGLRNRKFLTGPLGLAMTIVGYLAKLLPTTIWKPSTLTPWAQGTGAIYPLADSLRKPALWEFNRNGWTFHSKGMWFYIFNNRYPSATVIGSSNFGLRSRFRDLDISFLIETSDPRLQKQFHDEIQLIRCHSKQVPEADVLVRRCPVWLQWFLDWAGLKSFL